MKYMTFRSSCSYAGVANMLEHYGVDTDDRTIAMGMKLPYLFSYKDGTYMSGPMLQSAEWFNLYLHSIGFEMTEEEITAPQVPAYLKQQKTAMLGLRVDDGGKHAVVYTGCLNGKLVFLNNKWEHTDVPEQIMLREEELISQIDSSAMIAILKPITSRAVDLTDKIIRSKTVIRENLAEILELCSRENTVGMLRSKLNPLFRPLLLDGITMLGLIGEKELGQRFSALQCSFLHALRQSPDASIVLGHYMDMDELVAAAGAYIALIDSA